MGKYSNSTEISLSNKPNAVLQLPAEQASSPSAWLVDLVGLALLPEARLHASIKQPSEELKVKHETKCIFLYYTV